MNTRHTFWGAADQREVGSRQLGARKGDRTSTTVQKATGAVNDDACTVFDDGAALLFGELSSLLLTTRVSGFFRCMRTIDDRGQAPRLFRCIHSAFGGQVLKFFSDF